MAKNLPSNEYWGRRSGYFCTKRPKGMKHQFGWCIPQKNWSSAAINRPVVVSNTGKKGSK